MNPAHHPTNRSRSTSANPRDTSTQRKGSTTSQGTAATTTNAYSSVFNQAQHSPSSSRRNTSDQMMDSVTESPSAERGRSHSNGLQQNYSFTFNPNQVQPRTVQGVSSAGLHHAPSVAASYAKSTGSRHDQSRRSSASERSSFSPTPYSTGVPLKTKRKLRKNNREKQRRSELNDKFDELSELLRLGSSSSGGKVEKFSVLSEAVLLINTLRKETFELRSEKAELRAEVMKLSTALTQHAHAAITSASSSLPSVAALSPKTGLPFATMAAVAAPGGASPMHALSFSSAFPFGVTLPSPSGQSQAGGVNSAFPFTSPITATPNLGHRRGGGPAGGSLFASTGSFAFAGVPALITGHGSQGGSTKMELSSGPNSAAATPSHHNRQLSTSSFFQLGSVPSQVVQANPIAMITGQPAAAAVAPQHGHGRRNSILNNNNSSSMFGSMGNFTQQFFNQQAQQAQPQQQQSFLSQQVQTQSQAQQQSFLQQAHLAASQVQQQSQKHQAAARERERDTSHARRNSQANAQSAPFVAAAIAASFSSSSGHSALSNSNSNPGSFAVGGMMSVSEDGGLVVGSLGSHGGGTLLENIGETQSPPDLNFFSNKSFENMDDEVTFAAF